MNKHGKIDIPDIRIPDRIGPYETIGRWTGTALGYSAVGVLGWKAATALVTGTALFTVGAIAVGPFVGVLAIAGALGAAAVGVDRLVYQRNKVGTNQHNASKASGALLGAWPLTGISLLFNLGGMLNTQGVGGNAMAYSLFAKGAAATAGFVALTTIPMSAATLSGSIGRHFDNRATIGHLTDTRNSTHSFTLVP